MIFNTLKDKAIKHQHLVYVANSNTTDQLTGQTQNIVSGTTSVESSDGHSHPVVGNEQGLPVLLPAGKVPHTHEIDMEEVASETYEIQDDEIFEGKSDEEIVSTARKLFDDAANLEEDSRKKGEESEKFYKGDQWSKEDKEKLRMEDRVSLTINEVEAKVDLLCGFASQSYTDIRVFPIEAGDKDVAEVLTEVIKNITDSVNLNRVESSVFLDEVVVGRGLFNVFVDYNRNPLGNIIIEKLNWRDCYFSQHEKSNLEDCDYMVKVKSFPRNKVSRQYPEKAEEIKMMANSASILEAEKYSSDYVKKRVGQLDENIINANLHDIDAIKQTLKVYEMWYKQYSEKYTVVDYNSGDVKEYSNLTKSTINKLEKMGLTVLRRVITTMKILKWTGNILLSNENEDVDKFPVIPVYGKHIGGDFYGKVEPAKDVQREINKRTSNAVDVVNKMSSYVYFYDSSTFQDQKDEQAFRENAMKPGATFKVNNIANRPVKDQGINYPAELATAVQMASTKMNVILNIPQEAQGFASREISSVALVETRRSTMQANDFLFNNLADSKKYLAKVLVGMIQKTYTPDRIARIVLSNKPPKDQAEAEKNARYTAAIQEIFTTKDLRDYDISVELSPSAPTIRSANFALLLELARNGMPIPPEIIINNSDLPDKEGILATIRGQQQQQQQAEQQKVESEIMKTKIAADSKQQIAAMKSGQPIQQPQGQMPSGM